MDIGKNSVGKTNYQLYPHDFDDLVFMIYQHGNVMNKAPRSSVKPILQWLIIIVIAALILHGLRKIVKRREQRILHISNNNAAPDYLVGSFVDSVGVFLGVALHRIGNRRTERWFLISFSLFGLLQNDLH